MHKFGHDTKDFLLLAEFLQKHTLSNTVVRPGLRPVSFAFHSLLH